MSEWQGHLLSCCEQLKTNGHRVTRHLLASCKRGVREFEASHLVLAAPPIKWNRTTHQRQIITTTGRPLKHSLLTYSSLIVSGEFQPLDTSCTQDSIPRYTRFVVQNYTGANTVFKHIRRGPSYQISLSPLIERKIRTPSENQWKLGLLLKSKFAHNVDLVHGFRYTVDITILTDGRWREGMWR